MVCLGNICRSPMAQAIMESLVREKGLDWIIDSAGTNGLHDGESPDVRAIEEIKRRGALFPALTPVAAGAFWG